MKKLLGILVLGFILSSCTPTNYTAEPIIEGYYQGKNDRYKQGISKAMFCEGEWPTIGQNSFCRKASTYFQNGIEVNDTLKVKGQKRFAIFKNVNIPIKSGYYGKNFGDGTFHAIVYSWSEAQEIINNLRAGTTTGSNIEFTTSIGKHKNTCKELGFTPGTEAFGNCALKLIELEVAQQGNNKAVQQFQIVRQEPAYDGWMGELGLSILRGDFNKKVQQPAYRFPTQQRSICRFRDGGIGKPYMTCTTR